MIGEDPIVRSGIDFLHAYVAAHNDCVRNGDWEPLGDWFAEDAALTFEGVPVGPFTGREEIAAAYRERPPDDQVLIFDTEEEDGGRIVAGYGWLRKPAKKAGTMLLTPRDGKIAKLVVTFEASDSAATA